MMHLTLTGFDNQFYDTGDWDALNAWIRARDDLQVEFAFLMYPKKYGQQRYPDHSHIHMMISSSKAHLNSLHLCGNDIIREFLLIHKDGWYLHEYSDRIQLNGDWSDKDLYQLFLKSEIEKPIILQYNATNAGIFASKPPSIHNVHYLLDESRGNGIPADFHHWNQLWKQMKNEYVGFAGGINLSNIEKAIKNLQSANYGDNYWIDLETGCRDNCNHMDLITVTELICKFYRCVMEGQ